MDLKKAAKLFAGKFATGSSVSKNPQGEDEIVIQGDVGDDIVSLEGGVVRLLCTSIFGAVFRKGGSPLIFGDPIALRYGVASRPPHAAVMAREQRS